MPYRITKETFSIKMTFKLWRLIEKSCGKKLNNKKEVFERNMKFLKKFYVIGLKIKTKTV